MGEVVVEVGLGNIEKCLADSLVGVTCGGESGVPGTDAGSELEELLIEAD